jgi:hypothetical protein
MSEQLVTKVRQIEMLLVHQLVVFTILAVSIILFFLFNLMSVPQNDFMYGVAAAVWAQHGRLYTDVPFIQAPLSIILSLSFTKITGNVDVYLFARITSILLVLAAVLLPLFGKAKDKDLAIWSVYIALCLTNPYITSNSREIPNYAISLLCLSASVAIISAHGSALWRGFFASAAIGLSVSAKLYFIVLSPGIFLMFLLSEDRSRHLKVILGCLIGFLFGCAPILYFMIFDYQNFLKWNVYFHRLLLNVLTMEGTVSLSQSAKVMTVFFGLMSIPIGFTVAAMVEEHRRLGSVPVGAGRLILLVFAALMAVSPVRVLMQYLGPLALLLFQFSMPRRFSSEVLRFRYIACAVPLLLVQGVIATRFIADNFNANDGLAVVQILKLQKHAREIVDNNYKCERKFYSAEPLFLLDNKVKYPRELAAGPFLLFLGRRNLTGIGKDFDVAASIERWNPDVVIWGYFLGNKPERDEVDRAVRDYAIERAFTITSVGHLEGRDIYLAYRSDCRS